MSDNQPVRTIGRYQILEELGRGAMGIVYKGHDPVIGRTVALKTIAIQGDEAEMPDLRQRLYREACAAGTLTHPNIVTVYDVIEESGMTAVAMEFVEGETLKELINARAPMHVEMALDLFEQIAAALDYAANRKVVHRDIKPANIMVTFDGRAKVADFGLARVGGSTITNTATIMGTPSYMSPEQARGMPLDGRSDLFSAAAVLYEMLTRQKVFAGKDLGDTLERIVSKPTPLASQFNPALDPAVCKILDRALSKDPDNRFPTGAELVKALRRVTETLSLPTMEVPDVADPDARTIIMMPRVSLTTMTGTQVVQPAAPAPRPQLVARMRGSAAPALREVPRPDDPVLQREHPPQSDRAGSSRGLIVAIVVAAVVIGGAAIAVVTMLRKQAAPASSASGAAQNAAASTQTKAEPAPPAPVETPTPVAAPPVSVKPGPGKGQTRTTPPRASVDTPVENPRPAPPPPPASATLQLAFDGAPYPLTILSDGKSIGRVSEGQTSLSVETGRLRLRAVNEQLYLDQDLGAISLAQGERRTLTLPGTAVAVIGVRGENYSGLRILLDGRALAGPYPAQLPRIAAAPHKIEFRWTDGALQGVTIADTIDLSNGRQFSIRAVPEGAQVTVQKVR